MPSWYSPRTPWSCRRTAGWSGHSAFSASAAGVGAPAVRRHRHGAGPPATTGAAGRGHRSCLDAEQLDLVAGLPDQRTASGRDVRVGWPGPRRRGDRPHREHLGPAVEGIGPRRASRLRGRVPRGVRRAGSLRDRTETAPRRTRKKFLIDLATEVFSRLSTLEARQTPGVMRALADSAGAGDIQMWFADEERQNLLKGAAVEGSLPEPDGDFLQLAESNVTASKANLGLTREINYAVSRNDDGRMAAQVTLSYHNDGPDSEVNPYYNGLIRLYVPRGAELVGSTGTISDAPDGPYRVITASVFVPADGGRRTVTFEYLLPDDVVVDGTYRLTVVRQPGTPRDRYTAVIEGRRYDLEPGQRRLEVERDVAA